MSPFPCCVTRCLTPGRALGRAGTAYEKQGDLVNAIKYYSKSLTEHRTADVLNKLRAVSVDALVVVMVLTTWDRRRKQRRRLRSKRTSIPNWPRRRERRVMCTSRLERLSRLSSVTPRPSSDYRMFFAVGDGMTLTLTLQIRPPSVQQPSSSIHQARRPP